MKTTQKDLALLSFLHCFPRCVAIVSIKSGIDESSWVLVIDVCLVALCYDGGVCVSFMAAVLTVTHFVSAAAPEIIDERPVSLATDIWSVGVLVYVM